MGDRVLIQLKVRRAGSTEFSPVFYGHWSGYRTPIYLSEFEERMKGRAGDCPYSFARLVQTFIGASGGNIGFGVWNHVAELTKADSHGDAGVVVVDVTNERHTYECLGGYLKVDASGKVVVE